MIGAMELTVSITAKRAKKPFISPHYFVFFATFCNIFQIVIHIFISERTAGRSDTAEKTS